MEGILKALYDAFYDHLPVTELKQEIEACHKQLIETLDKPSRRLVLQIIDAKDHITEDTSIDSFISGFILACQLCVEISEHRWQKTRRSTEQVFIANERSS